MFFFYTSYNKLTKTIIFYLFFYEKLLLSKMLFLIKIIRHCKFNETTQKLRNTRDKITQESKSTKKPAERHINNEPS